MLSLKYIRIRNERPLEQRLASIWRAACTEFKIPCILIYLEENAAYISANLKHLAEKPDFQEKKAFTQQTLQALQYQYTGSARGYWKHNDYYYTFEAIPRSEAQALATEIFQTLIAEVPETAAEKTLKPVPLAKS
ncbi:hypothetical protein I5M27_14790 [Adhaeribacter sp. BT258]|uniref:Uncharacterized protein n=1 Tax=Adhaeribacter terrigena TaxID=2793070 RepID=A0ABS1C4D7_9BACT|nr:hypothetical protein [Adhaeribacter terrigena]MBK0404261.1 hypothetical protein [Adhaeribacter terrigena]